MQLPRLLCELVGTLLTETSMFCFLNFQSATLPMAGMEGFIGARGDRSPPHPLFIEGT